MTDRVIFVTRKFPPSVGGMETAAESMWSVLSAANPRAELLALGRGNPHLVWWFPWAWWRLRAKLRSGQVRAVIAGDALVNAVMRSAVKRFDVPMVVMVHGRDITYANPLYRKAVIPALRTASRVLSNSRATKELAVSQGVPRDRIELIRLAVDPVESPRTSRVERQRALCLALGLGGDAQILVTVGRLVKRKGVRWFVGEVLPHLPETVHYVVAGSGREASLVQKTARQAGCADRVHLLGRVPDAERERLLYGADIFIQPNIPVKGDIEGFGLVAVEAALRGAPVVASRLEGLQDAVTDGETGMLLEPENPAVWVAALLDLLADPQALQTMGEQAARRAGQLYSIEALKADLLQALDF